MKPTTNDVSELRERVQALIDRGPRPPAFLEGRQLDLAVFVLAVIGAAVSILFAGAALWPLAKLSFGYWFP